MNVMYHRGPDDCGMYIENEIGMAMRRLSIIDLEKGKQPITNEDDSLVLVFNGEIYNYRELRSNLGKGEEDYETESDTETIIHQYDEHGFDCVYELH